MHVDCVQNFDGISLVERLIGRPWRKWEWYKDGYGRWYCSYVATLFRCVSKLHLPTGDIDWLAQLSARSVRNGVFTETALLTVACRYSLLTKDLAVQNENHIPPFGWVEELLLAGEEKKTRE